MQANRSFHTFVVLRQHAAGRVVGVVDARKRTTFYRRLLLLCLVLICAGTLAEAQPCPPTFGEWVTIGTGSCAIPGLGTVSNIRFNGSATNGGVIPTIPEMSIEAGPIDFLGINYGALPMPGTYGIIEPFQVPTGQTIGSTGSTSTVNFAYKLTPDAGLTIGGASTIVAYGAFGVGGGTGSAGVSLSLCLNGNFTGFPPSSCSGTTQNITYPTVNFPPFSIPPAASATFSATSMDVFVSSTGSGSVDGLYPQQGFTIGGQSSQPLPTISAVVNAASNILPGLPNAGIAQGSIFLVYGSNLGPASISIANAPFQTTNQAGTSVYVTVGNQMVTAPMYYTSSGQVAALLPSNTPVGTGSVVVTYNNLAGSTFPVTVVENNLGIFTVTSNGEGAGIVTYPDYSLVSAVKAANCGAPLTACGAANPGDILILWATGLGPVDGTDTTGAGLGVNMPSIPLTLWLGGVPVIPIYQGRSGYIGEDQINFKVPANVPTGCAVPLTVQIGNEISNSTVMPVANGSRTCTPTNPAITPSIMQALSGSAPLTIGKVDLERQASTSSNTGYVDIGKAQFEKVTVASGLQPFMVSYVDTEPAGTCVIYNNLSTSTNPPFLSMAGIDAGPSLSVSGPNGTQSLTLTPGLIPTEYDGTLNSVGKFLAPGEYTVTGSGGADVGSFNAQFNLPTPPNWSNQSSLGTVTLANGLTINWGGVLGNNAILIEGVSATDKTLTNGAAFSCAAPASAGTFTVPPAVLLALPAGSYGTLYFKPAITPLGFTASGLSLGYVTSNLLTAIPTAFQ